jgi:putative peptidoglycan lipid II flippase
MQKVLSPLYYAREDTRSPFRYALHAMIVNAAVALGLASFIGFIAAALGTTVAGWVMMLQLWLGSRRMGDAAAPDARLRRAMPRILLASVAMGVVLVVAARLLAGALEDSGLRYLALLILVGLGFLAYLAAVFAFGAIRPADVRAALRRSPAASL